MTVKRFFVRMLVWIALYDCLWDMTLGKILVNLEVLSFHPEYLSLQYYSIPGDVVIAAIGFAFSVFLFLKIMKFELVKLGQEIEKERVPHVVMVEERRIR